MPSINVEGADDFNAAIDALIRRVNDATRSAVATGGHLIERNAKNEFQGDHGKGEPHIGGRNPNVVSGTLYRSIKLIPPTPEPIGPGTWRVSVAPTTKYGRRIELGFSGTDSLGRHYGAPVNPSPYPFLKPGLDKAIPLLPIVFRDAWAAAMEG